MAITVQKICTCFISCNEYEYYGFEDIKNTNTTTCCQQLRLQTIGLYSKKGIVEITVLNLKSFLQYEAK